MARIPLKITDMPDFSETGQTFSRIFGVWFTVLLCSAALLFAALLASNVAP